MAPKAKKNEELDDDDRKPEDVIVVHKQTFLSCMQALGIYLGNTFDMIAQVEQSSLAEDSKKMMLDILKGDINTIGNISQALEMSMDYKIETDVKKEYIN